MLRSSADGSGGVDRLASAAADAKMRVAGEPVEAVGEIVEVLEGILEEDGHALSSGEEKVELPALSTDERKVLERAHPLALQAWDRLYQTATATGSPDAVELLDQLLKEARAILNAWRDEGGSIETA
jgi:hypothetical protein